MKLSAARASVSRKTNQIEIPADSIFAAATIAAAANGKGSKSDKRRNDRKAMRLIQGRNA
jgi:hypothetical protein